MSEGCDNCYADALSRRLLRSIYTRKLPVVDTSTNREDPFALRVWPERLSQPARWRGGRLVFVNSMSDLMHRHWATDLRDECLALGVPFFFKQWGGRTPKAGGRELEGREWNQMPEAHRPGESSGGRWE